MFTITNPLVTNVTQTDFLERRKIKAKSFCNKEIRQEAISSVANKPN